MLANLPTFQTNNNGRHIYQHQQQHQQKQHFGSEDKLLLKIVSLAQMIVMKRPDVLSSPTQGIAACGSSSRRLIFLLAAYHRIYLALKSSVAIDHTRIVDLLSLLCKCTLAQSKKLLENSSSKSSESNWIVPLLTKIHQKEKRKFLCKWKSLLVERKPMPPKSSWSELDDEDLLPSLKPVTLARPYYQEQLYRRDDDHDSLSAAPRTLLLEQKRKTLSRWRLSLRSMQMCKYSKINQLEKCFQVWRQYGPLHHRFQQYTCKEPYHPFHSLDDNRSILESLPPPFNKNLNLITFAMALDIHSYSSNVRGNSDGKHKFSSKKLITSLSRFLVREWRSLQRLKRVERELNRYKRIPILRDFFSKWRSGNGYNYSSRTKNINNNDDGYFKANKYSNHLHNYDEIVNNRHNRMFLGKLLGHWRTAAREKYYREMDSVDSFNLVRKDSVLIDWKAALKKRRTALRSLKIWRTLPAYHGDREEQAIQFWKERWTSKIFLSWRTNNSISTSMMGAAQRWDERMSTKKMMFMLMVWREMLRWVTKTVAKVDQFHSKKLVRLHFCSWTQKLTKKRETHNLKISFLGKWRFASLNGRFRKKTINRERRTLLKVWLLELSRRKTLNTWNSSKADSRKRRILQSWRLHQLISKIDRYKSGGKRLFLYKWRIILISLRSRQKQLREMSNSCTKVLKSRFFSAWQNRFQSEMITIALLEKQYHSFLEERRRRFMMLWKLQTLTSITLRLKELEKKGKVLWGWRKFALSCQSRRNERIKRTFLLRWRQHGHQCLAVEFDDERGRKLISSVFGWWRQASKLQVESHRKSMEWISTNLVRFHFQRWRMEAALNTYNRT